MSDQDYIIENGVKVYANPLAKTVVSLRRELAAAEERNAALIRFCECVIKDETRREDDEQRWLSRLANLLEPPTFSPLAAIVTPTEEGK